MMNEPYARPRNLFLNRRVFLAGSAFALSSFHAMSARANSVIGTASDVRGTVNLQRAEKRAGLSTGADLLDRDQVRTEAESFADLQLDDTRILLGSETELLLDSFIAGQGGTLELGTGAMVFDRPEGLAKIDLSVRTAFGMIGVRGTKFFCGPSRGVFAVFCEHGQVSVQGGAVERLLGPGEGVEVAEAGGAPNDVVRWGEARIVEAYASVGLAR